MVQSPAANKSDNLALRVASSLVLAPLVLAAIWYGGMPFIIALAAVGGLAGYEWANLINRDADMADIIVPPIMLAALVVIGGFIKISSAILLPIVGGVLVFAFATFRKANQPALLAGGTFYIGTALLAALVLRLHALDGLAWSLVLCAVVWATDIGAYVAGRTIGGPKLAPLISPAKTWAGLVGGIAAAVAAAAFTVSIFNHWPIAATMILAGVLAVTAQAGDLLESFMKRRVGAGDSGRLIPGHGGILDRIDGLLPAAIVLCVFVLLTEPAR